MSRILWYVLAGVLALVTIVTQLDRQSRRSPDLAANVPGPFRSFAQERIATARLRSGDAEAAVREARTLIRRRPVPAENLFLLAAAQAAAGNGEEASRALELSAERGWRAPDVQRIMVPAALASDLVEPAAARLLALWSIGVDRSVVAPLTTQVLAAPGGPEAFGKLLAQSRFTRDIVIRQSWAMTTPLNYARMVQASAKAGARIDCRIVSQHAARLSQKGSATEAALLQEACPGAAAER